MANRHTYVKVFDDLEDHPRWQEVDSLAEAVGMWTLSMNYCSRNRTDGHFPERLAVRRWNGSTDVVFELVEAGRWHVPGHDCADCPQPADGSLFVHAYLDHQRSRDEIEGISVKRSASGKLGAKARLANQLANQGAEQTSGKPKQTSSKVKPDTDTDTKKEHVAADADFEKFWTLYPRREGKAAATRAWAKAIKAADVPTIAAGLRTAVAGWEADRTERRYIPLPASWLNGQRWTDEATTTVAVPVGPRKTANQCDEREHHPRHDWQWKANLHFCHGVTA